MVDSYVRTYVRQVATLLVGWHTRAVYEASTSLSRFTSRGTPLGAAAHVYERVG